MSTLSRILQVVIRVAYHAWKIVGRRQMSIPFRTFLDKILTPVLISAFDPKDIESGLCDIVVNPPADIETVTGLE